MKDVTRRKIIRALRKYADGIMTFIGQALLSFDPRAQRAFRRTFQTAMRAHVGEIDRQLRMRPEPTPEQLRNLLQKAEEPIGEEVGEVEINAMMRSFLRGWLRKLPPFPPGKPPSLTLQQRKKAISEVRRLVTTGGMARKAAYEKVAKRYDVHWRTIQNLWIKIHKQTRKGGIE
jgi:hypothetical protein